MIKKLDLQITSYFFISIIIFAFFASESSYLAQNIIVPYINMSPLYIHLAVTCILIITIVLFIKVKEIWLDLIFVFLCMRIASSIIPLFYISEAFESAGRVTVPIIAALAYFIGRQFTGDLRNIVKINIIFTVIISLQTLFTVQNMVVPHPSLYTQYVKIPLASSNLIAAYLTPSIFLTLAGYTGRWYIKYSVIALAFLALIASTSDGGILILSLMFIVYKVYLNKNFKLTKVFVTLAIILGVIYALINGESLSKLTHGRYDLIIKDLSKWTDHLFFGNGMIYEGRGSGTHNIFVDLLVQNGLIGLFLYAAPLLILFKKIANEKYNQVLGFKLYLVAALLHSLIETSYFNYINDMFFWFITGVMISHTRKIDKLYYT